MQQRRSATYLQTTEQLNAPVHGQYYWRLRIIVKEKYQELGRMFPTQILVEGRTINKRQI